MAKCPKDGHFLFQKKKKNLSNTKENDTEFPHDFWVSTVGTWYQNGGQDWTCITKRAWAWNFLQLFRSLEEQQGRGSNYSFKLLFHSLPQLIKESNVPTSPFLDLLDI